MLKEEAHNSKISRDTLIAALYDLLPSDSILHEYEDLLLAPIEN